MDSTQFVVRRDQLGEHALVTEPLAPGPGTVTLRVDRFGFTANNITYGVLGDLLSYWSCFPATEPGWGILPVWGLGTVERSEVTGVAVGERVYGYFPMASHLIVQPRRIGETGFLDGAPQRSAVSSVYNQYLRTTRDPLYRADTEPYQAVLRPLFATAYFLADHLAEQDLFGAGAVVLSSASSKLAIATARELAAASAGRARIGLTSARNVERVAALGLYDRVFAYDDLAGLEAPDGAVLIDIAGDGGVRAAVHAQLGDRLRRTLGVGATHRDASVAGAGLGAEPFFAPAWIKHRTEQWGAAAVQHRLGEAWHGFLAEVRARDWLTIVTGAGPAEVARIYDDVLAGRARPEHGYVLTLAA